MRNVMRYLRNEEGIETLEWILMGACIVALGILVYGGPNSTLVTALNDTITSIAGKLAAL